MGHLEEVEPRQVRRHEVPVDGLFDVAGEQKAPPADRPEQDHRDVVDAGPPVGRVLGHATGDGPQHVKADLVDGDPVAGGDRPARHAPIASERLGPGRVAWARTAHAGLEHPPDPVPRQQHREAGDVVLVRVRQHQDVDPAVPRWEATIERDEQPVRVRTTVDQQPAPG